MFREVDVGGLCKSDSLQIKYLQRLTSLCIYTILIQTFKQSHSGLEKVSPNEIMFVGGKLGSDMAQRMCRRLQSNKISLQEILSFELSAGISYGHILTLS